MPLKTLVACFAIYFALFALLTPSVFAAGKKNADTERVFVRSEPEGGRPAWVNTTPKSNTELYFVGVSHAYSTATDARSDAREDSFKQIVKYYGEFIQSTAKTRTSVAGSSADVLDRYILGEEEITSFAQNIVNEVSASNYYTEIYQTGKKQEYIVYVLCDIPRKKAEAQIANFEQNVSERYAPLLAGQNTLIAMLSAYNTVQTSLAENPLHRAVAYYDSPAGRASLYDYCTVQINALLAGVSFAPIASETVSRGGTVSKTITLKSSNFAKIGSADCKITVAGKTAVPDAVYTVNSENSFVVKIFTDKLEAGNYNASLEFLTGALPSGSSGAKSGFSFEVLPLNTVQIVCADANAERLRAKVSAILQAQDLLLVDANGGYTVRIEFEAEARSDANYFYVQPVVSISAVLQGSDKPVVTFSKKYGEVRHVTQNEALERALRSIESDLDKEFTLKLAAVMAESQKR